MAHGATFSAELLALASRAGRRRAFVGLASLLSSAVADGASDASNGAVRVISTNSAVSLGAVSTSADSRLALRSAETLVLASALGAVGDFAVARRGAVSDLARVRSRAAGVLSAGEALVPGAVIASASGGVAAVLAHGLSADTVLIDPSAKGVVALSAVGALGAVGVVRADSAVGLGAAGTVALGLSA